MAFVIGLGLTMGRAAQGQSSETPTDVSLEWEAPRECPTRLDVMSAVSRVIGRQGGHLPLNARARVEQTGVGTWRAEITMLTAGESSTRQVEGSSCGAVTDALVLIVSLALNGTPPPSRELPPIPESRPLTRPVPVASPTPPLESRAPDSSLPLRPRWAIFPALVVDSGSLPSVAIGGALGLSFRVWRFDLTATAILLGSSSAVLAADSTEGSHFLLFDARPGVSFHLVDAPRWMLGPAAGVGAEWVFASGFGSQFPSNVTATVPSANVGIRAEAWVTPRFGARLALDAVIPFSHPRFVIDHEGTSAGLFSLPPVAARGFLGALWRF
jgi:hypothetical protein